MAKINERTIYDVTFEIATRYHNKRLREVNFLEYWNNMNELVQEGESIAREPKDRLSEFVGALEAEGISFSCLKKEISTRIPTKN